MRSGTLPRLRLSSCSLNRNGAAADLTQAVPGANCAASAAANVTEKAAAKWRVGIILRLAAVAREGRKGMNRQREEEQQYLATAVNFNLNMWRDSGEIDYLHKAIANIRATIEKEEGKENERL